MPRKQDLNLQDEVAFLVGVALDTLDTRTVIQALEYRHNGNITPDEVAQVRRSYSRVAAGLPELVSTLPLPHMTLPNNNILIPKGSPVYDLHRSTPLRQLQAGQGL